MILLGGSFPTGPHSTAGNGKDGHVAAHWLRPCSVDGGRAIIRRIVDGHLNRVPDLKRIHSQKRIQL